MAESEQRLQEAERQGFEPADVSIRGVLWVGLIFGVTVGLSAAALGGLVWIFDLATERPVLSPIERTEVVPPEPRLDPRPAQTLVEIRRREDGLLGSYELVDPDAGIARIPIGQAMDLLAERGWPAEGQGGGPVEESRQ